MPTIAIKLKQNSPIFAHQLSIKWGKAHLVKTIFSLNIDWFTDWIQFFLHIQWEIGGQSEWCAENIEHHNSIEKIRGTIQKWHDRQMANWIQYNLDNKGIAKTTYRIESKKTASPAAAAAAAPRKRFNKKGMVRWLIEWRNKNTRKWLK